MYVCLHTHTYIYTVLLLPINIRRQSRLTTTTTYRLRSIYEWSGLPRLLLSFCPHVHRYL